ncbi:putative odorant receptor 92a [Maniola hyperantus]|uniref:putative odorant receptor 92a n=1 Tax=Aphantopus hyperantus TaxID=2795564 RepID=UPI0015696FB6|nr:odorant receptor 94a-like [Maniola hyperantus]
METKLAYNCLAPHILNLRIAGCFHIDRKSPKLYKNLHVCFIGVTFACMLVYTTQQAIKLFEVRDDMDKVMGTIFLFLTHSDSIYKQVVMLLKAEEIQELLDIMKGPLFNQGEPDHEKYFKETAYYGKLLLQADNYMALCTCFLWVLYPFILHVQGKQTEFAIWIPYDGNLELNFYLTSLYVWTLTSWVAFCNTTIDVTVAFLLAQCKAQLSILSNNLVYFIQRSKKESMITKAAFADVVSVRFENIVKHHVQILYFARRVQDIFGGAVAYQFIVSGWIICTSVYRMVDTDPASVQCWSMVLYICCILMQVSMYCYYGNEVTHESQKLKESAYLMNWLDSPLKHRNHLIFFMERVKKPILPLAGFIIPLSNNTFVSIVKSSYSFYALLRNTGKN